MFLPKPPSTMDRPSLMRLFSACDVNKGEFFCGGTDCRFGSSAVVLTLGVLLCSLREQLADLYQTIHSSANVSLLQEYEKTIYALINHSLDYRLECEQLETSLKRAEEMNSSHLAELEDDIQKQLVRTEGRVREEERRKMEDVVASMQRKHRNEVSELQATVDRLVKSQKESEYMESREEVMRLSRQISHLSLENEQLRSSLLQAHTDMAVLHSELDKLKNMYADQKAQHERETEHLKMMVMEYQSYSSQIQTLQETNRVLYDMCVCVHRSDPDDSKTSFTDVASWADKYLDSGVCVHMGAAEMSVSDYDSDHSRESVTVLNSYSSLHSEAEISDIKSEAAASVAPSTTSSVASSLRRRLSVFSSKPVEADVDESSGPAPMYRLVLAGDAGAGKSSFMLRLTLNEFKGDIQTTLGVDFQIKRMVVEGQKTSLQIWDTAGQERFRSIARSYFRKAHGVLLLYDVTSESSFLNVREWVDQIQDSTEETIPMCVIGNKVDLRDECREDRCVSTAEGEKLAKAYGALFCETSAKNGTNVVEAVLHLAREVKKNIKQGQRLESDVKLSPSNPKKTFNNCCGR
ncbi:ras and EF-hand domain-containing protein [Cynoglossus semilaevis]|uniref:ras and EF-hand domain-containing protein n=1 Tax=Cynoglossus semilaevis TaxID=244447 RepID=UPI000D628840|nr:ras and EF-hand domain-containing protein-like [Cynoglossus semilaevis]